MAKISVFMHEKQPPLGLERYTKNIAAQTMAKSAGYEPKKVSLFDTNTTPLFNIVICEYN